MKKSLLGILTLGVVLAVFAAPVRADDNEHNPPGETSAGESNRGFYEGNLTSGGKVVFFVQGNRALSAYVFDVAGRQAAFGGGALGANGAFTLTLSSNATITGTVSPSAVTATINGQTVTSNRVPPFGGSSQLGGRFAAVATSSAGAAYDLKIILDSQNNIFLIAKQGATILGGFGSVTVQPGPGPSPSPTPSPFNEDADEAQEHHEDSTTQTYNATFTLTLVTGETVTGNLSLSRDTLLGNFTLGGVVYTFRAGQESTANRLANISARAFVNTGQGQLISGFIIRGGPKMVVIRALGPSLASLGVNPALANPSLSLMRGQTVVAQNDDWQSAANANQVTASGLAPTDPLESVILIRLEPGAYTAIASGVAGGTGIGLVEVYEADRD